MANSLIYSYSSEEFKKIISKSYSYREALANLGYKSVSGTTTNLLKRRIQEENIDISHFGTKSTYHLLSRSVIFQKNSNISQHAVRNWFKKEPIEYKCSICGQEPIWQNKPLTLIMDHIDGNNSNNELSNLRWVCPNCNQQLETTGFKKIRVKEDTYEVFQLKDRTKKEYFCPQCGEPKSKNGELCISCASKARIKKLEEMPVTRDELKNLIRNKPFSQIGTMYHCSDNTIRKWCDKFELPRRKSDIQKYTDEEWKKL